MVAFYIRIENIYIYNKDENKSFSNYPHGGVMRTKFKGNGKDLGSDQ